MTFLQEKVFEESLQKIITNNKIYSTVLAVESGDDSLKWRGAAGDMVTDSKFFIASVTKLFVTAVVIRLIDQKKLNLEDKISRFLPKSYCEKLHVFQGNDYSAQLTVKHLISNTSGLPDYFFHKQASGKTVADELMSGKDEQWHLQRTIELVKRLKPNFAPGQKGKAAYSDTNYQLLGAIIESVTDMNIGQVFQEYIFNELGFQDTYTYCDIADDSPVAFYCDKQKLWLPNYMTSIAVEGGIVSTASELMRFTKAFFQGKFFAKDKIEQLKEWNMIKPPPGLFYFGVGLEKLFLPRIISPFKPLGEVLGFWGQTGSFAFYNPQTDLYFCGTTNQITGAGHREATSAIVKIIKKVERPVVS